MNPRANINSIKAFTAIMATLGDRFSRSISVPMVTMYQTALEGVLSPEQITQAVQIVCIEDTFFPSPARLIEAATGNIDHAARLQWDESLAAYQNNRASNLDQIAKACWRSLGGRELMLNRDADRLLKLRDDFLKDYTSRARAERINALALPSINPTNAEISEMQVP